MTSIFKRANLHGKSQAVLGDMTSHGGVIVAGSPANSWHGLPVARKGDGVFCPRCKPHFFRITEGLSNCTDTDAAIPMATEGHLTGCGAVLIAESAPPDQLLKVLSFLNGTGYDDRYVLRDIHGKAMPSSRRTLQMYWKASEYFLTIRAFNSTPDRPTWSRRKNS